MRNKIATSFRLSPTALDMLKRLSDNMGISQADVIEVALRDLSKKRNILEPYRITKTFQNIIKNTSEKLGVPVSDLIDEVVKEYEKQGREVVVEA